MPGVVASFAPTAYYIEALINFVYEFGNVFGIILKVGIESDYKLPLGVVDASTDSGGFAEIIAQANTFYGRLFAGYLFYY